MPSPARRIGVVALACTLAACSTPRTGRDDLATGRARVESLLREALGVLPDEADYVVPEEPGEQTCRRTILGFAVGSTGARRAEIPVIVEVPRGADTRAFLDDAARLWRAQGYDVDHPRTADGRYPKVRARVDDGYQVVMTAFTDRPQVTIYAVSPCLRDS